MMVAGSAARTGSCHNAPATPNSSNAHTAFWVQDLRDFRLRAGTAGGGGVGMSNPLWLRLDMSGESVLR